MYYRDYSVNKYAKGGEIGEVNTEVTTIKRNIMGTTSMMLKIKGMKKPQDFTVYPISAEQSGKPIMIQSDTRFGYLDLSSGEGLMSQSHANGAYSYHFSMDKKVPFRISETDLQRIKEHILSTAGSKVGSRGIVSDNSGAGMAKGGKMNEGVDLFIDNDGNDIPPKVQAILDKYEERLVDGMDYKEIAQLHDELYAIGYTFDSGLDAQPYDLRKIGQKGKSSSYAKGGMVVTSIKDIPNFKEELEAGNITYRGLGMGKIAKDFYNLAGTDGRSIKVKKKEYFITDEEFNTFSRDKITGKMVIKFDAPYRKG